MLFKCDTDAVRQAVRWNANYCTEVDWSHGVLIELPFVIASMHCSSTIGLFVRLMCFRFLFLLLRKSEKNAKSSDWDQTMLSLFPYDIFFPGLSFPLNSSMRDHRLMLRTWLKWRYRSSAMTIINDSSIWHGWWSCYLMLSGTTTHMSSYNNFHSQAKIDQRQMHYYNGAKEAFFIWWVDGWVAGLLLGSKEYAY